MNAKYCRKCGKFSYSSAGEGEWHCPTCRADLTNLPHYPAGHIDNTITRRKILTTYEGGLVNASSSYTARA